MAGKTEKQQTKPPQQQGDRPGHESLMRPRPATERREYKGASKLQDQVAIFTGPGAWRDSPDLTLGGVLLLPSSSRGYNN